MTSIYPPQKPKGGSIKWILFIGLGMIGVLILAIGALLFIGWRNPQIARRAGGAPPFTYVVDATVHPAVTTVPGYDGGAPRPVAAVVDPSGKVSNYVSNEIVVATTDMASLADTVEKYDGKVLFKIDPAAKGIPGGIPLYVLQVNPSKANLDRFAGDIEFLASQSGSMATGSYRFSDMNGVGLLAIAAQQARTGKMIGVNWQGKGTDIPNYSTVEAPAGPDGYDPDAYHWDYFAKSTIMDIGVPEAWSLMSRVGLLDNRVKIAILDGGFAPNDDFPQGTILSAVPWIDDPVNHRNPGECKSSCPWHATWVTSTAMALPDNNFGAAGTAGPVGEPLMILTTYDPVLSTSAILEAKSRGAKIINMSFQTQVPGVVGWTLLPYERVTEDVRNSGVLIFASAGNDGANMDREDCWWVFCWKATVYAPCENDGVICVAGIQANDYAGTENDSVGKHPGSNYGSKVDMYAPFSVYSGPDPDTGGNQAIGVSGTSFSSPYAAGVAALIWAANPALSAGDVWQVLYSTSHERYGMHWPNAYFAVLGQIPQSLFAEIRSPHSGSEVEVNQPIDFVGELTYISLPGDPATVDLTWKDNGNVFYQQEVTMPRASNDGINTMQVYATSNGLAAGDHTIRLEVEGNVRMVYTSLHTSANHEISLAVGNSPPTVTIHSPAEGATFCSGQHITFRGSAIDLGDIRIGIPDHNFRWYSSLWGGPFGEGPTYTSQLLPVGRQTITLRVTDSGGATGEDSTTMTVLDAGSAQCADFPPEAKILSPADGSKYTPTGTDEKGKYITVTLVGQATDREDAESELTVEWYSDVEGFLGSGRSLTVRLHAGTGPTTHTITLRVKDTAGHVTEDPIRIRIEVFV